MIPDLVTTFVTLFVIIDPIALLPIFISLTDGWDARARNALALRGVLVASIVLAVFGIAGEGLLGAIGIGMPAFRIAGGILLFIIALEMLFEKRTARREKSAESDSDPSVFPVAVPLLAGPGAITSMILLMEPQQSNLPGQAAVLGVLAAVMAINYAALLLSGPIGQVLGRTGINVVTRLLGMLLAALAVQFVVDGIKGSGLV